MIIGRASVTRPITRRPPSAACRPGTHTRRSEAQARSSRRRLHLWLRPYAFPPRHFC